MGLRVDKPGTSDQPSAVLRRRLGNADRKTSPKVIDMMIKETRPKVGPPIAKRASANLRRFRPGRSRNRRHPTQRQGGKLIGSIAHLFKRTCAETIQSILLRSRNARKPASSFLPPGELASQGNMVAPHGDIGGSGPLLRSTETRPRCRCCSCSMSLPLWGHMGFFC